MNDTQASEKNRWRAGPSDNLVWSEFEDAYVVYHRPSGRTHFLNAATADLLDHVLTAPRTARAAAEELAAREGAVGDSAFFAAVAESLSHLEHLGLIERCDP
jgi:PqqD family protein of HPr-rel-A system